MHIKLEFGSPKNDVVREGNTNFTIGTCSHLKITKSKLGPKFQNIPCYVDVRQGGVIDKVKSFYLYLRESDYISQGGGWMKLDPIFEYMDEKFSNKIDSEKLNSLKGNKREKDLIDIIRNDDNLLDFLQVFLIEKICDVYPAHSLVTNEYRQKLIDKCDYFIDKNVEKRNVSEEDVVEFETISEDDLIEANNDNVE